MELYELDSVPLTERKASGADLFMIWAGVSFCLPSFIEGALLVPAFSWSEALEINFWGNLVAGVLIVLGGYFGTKTGYPAVIYGRYVFGYSLGQWLPTVSLLLSTLGWFAVMNALTGMYLDKIVKDSTGFSSPLVMIILVGLLNASTAVLGYQKIRLMDWLSVPLLSLLCIWITVKIISSVSIPDAFQYKPTGSLSYGEGVDLIIGGFLSAVFAASDFSRYTRNNWSNWLGTFPGTFLISFLLGLVGMLSVVATGEWNPVLVVQDFGMGIPALIFILLANWTTNHSLLYSSGLALTNVLPQLGRCKNTLLCGVTGVILAVAGFADFLQSWLILLSCVFSPLVAVALTDFFLLKKTVENRAINMPAVIAVGMGIFQAKMTPPQYISSIVGLVSGSLFYLIITVLSRSRNP